MHPQTGNSVPIPPPPNKYISMSAYSQPTSNNNTRIRLGAAIVMETVATRPLHAGLVLVMIMSG